MDKQLMDLFEENELNIASLYALYAEKITDKTAFWIRLSEEEIIHAADISRSKTTIGEMTETKFSRGVISYVMDFVLEEIEKVKRDGTTHYDALHTALRIERSMLEKKLFDFFISTDKTVKNIFLKLNSETEEHVDILLAEMKKNRFTFKDPH